MTEISEAMVFSGDGLLLGKAWSEENGHWVRVQLDADPNESHPFMGIKHGKNGQRMFCTFTLRGDDEQLQHKDDAKKKPKRSWDELKPSEQAGILCNDDKFNLFVDETTGGLMSPAEFIRSEFEIVSRSELNDIPDAWNAFVSKWRDRKQHRAWS